MTEPTPSAWNPSLGDRLRWIWSYWRPHWPFVFLLLFLTLVSSAVAIAYPLVFRHVLDRIAEGVGADSLDSIVKGTVPPDELQRIIGILLLIALGRFVAKLYPAARAWVNLKLDMGIRERVFGSVLEKDHRFFSHFRTGDLVTRLMDDITEYPKLAWFCCSGIFRALESGSKLVFCVGAMVVLDPKLAVLAALPLPLMLALIYRIRMRLREAILAQQKSISQTNDMLESTFSGIRIVKAFAAEAGPSRHLDEILTERVEIQFRVRRLFATVDVLDTVASRVGQLVVLVVGGTMVVQGQLSLGTLYAFYMYLDMLIEPMVDLPNLLVTSRQAFVCMDREEELLRYPVTVKHFISPASTDTPVTVAAPATGVAEPAPREPIESIELANVTFSYGNGRRQLDGVDVILRRGETVAVVGEVGSGKSTLLSLLAGFLEPDEGTLRINGRPLAPAEFGEYRSQLGYVPQQPLLFSETIAENVEMGRPSPNGSGSDGSGSDGSTPNRSGTTGSGADRSRTTESGSEGSGRSKHWTDELLRMVRMEDELARMQEGSATMLGQKGTRISGGQRQRLSIARALYARPRLLLLDDCTASLDAENEDRLWAGLRAMVPGAIIVLVSHRLATVRRADRILVMEEGRVVDKGLHDELARSSAIYQRVLQRETEREQVAGASRE
ncbi:MAG: ABC transporter ATP-binding protein [Candidatus Eisenbacteria bacterium]